MIRFEGDLTLGKGAAVGVLLEGGGEEEKLAAAEDLTGDELKDERYDDGGDESFGNGAAILLKLFVERSGVRGACGQEVVLLAMMILVVLFPLFAALSPSSLASASAAEPIAISFSIFSYAAATYRLTKTEREVSQEAAESHILLATGIIRRMRKKFRKIKFSEISIVSRQTHPLLKYVFCVR